MFKHVKKNFILFKKKVLVKKYFLVALAGILFGCAEKNWKDHGDSCILISENPPLKRVINYTDYDLCDRKFSPRTAPNPKTRVQKGKS